MFYSWREFSCEWPSHGWIRLRLCDALFWGHLVSDDVVICVRLIHVSICVTHDDSIWLCYDDDHFMISLMIMLWCWYRQTTQMTMIWFDVDQMLYVSVMFFIWFTCYMMLSWFNMIKWICNVKMLIIALMLIYMYHLL